MSRHHRKSLSEAFPDLEISPSKRSTAKSIDTAAKVKMQDPLNTLQKTFSRGWPSWGSIRGTKLPVTFTIRLAQYLRDEARKTNFIADPAKIITTVRKESQKGGVQAVTELWGEIENGLITVVYGSNMIESAGSSYDLTIKLCREVFRGRAVPLDIEERDPEYQAALENLLKTNRRADRIGVLRSRREVVQHAAALSYAIDKIVLENHPWSEELILEIHRMLYDGLESEDVHAGKYRDHEVAVSYHEPGKKLKSNPCIRASAVPKYMKSLVKNLDAQILATEAGGELDPYTLAAQYHHQFVMIHPFGDGNGRMSRIILNVLLLKHAGHLTEFGSDTEDKEEYLGIVRRGQKQFNKEDMEVEFQAQTSHQEFSKFVLTKSKRTLERMWTWAKGRETVVEEKEKGKADLD